jgi:hypothetical protein
MLAAPGFVSAQYVSTGVPSFGGGQVSVPTEPNYSGLSSGVSFIDSALPRTMLQTRIDYDSDDRRATRADYIFSKRGYPVAEPRLDMTEFNTRVEFAPSPWFSVFLGQPYRWVDPEVNRNRTGMADTDFGFKLAVWDTSNILATFQLRGTAPTATQAEIDNRHWTIEPGLLFNVKLISVLTLEGQACYGMTLSDYPFAGDVARYGLGIVWGQRNNAQYWITPVVEAVGWTVTSGQVEIVHPLGVETRGASGTTILNGAAGLRMGIGENLEIYGGYSRAVTGPAWFRDLFRLEMRLAY